MRLAKRAAAISPSPTLAITAKAKEMQKQGIDIIGFGAGEPDFDTPEHIKQSAIAAIEQGFTKYTPAAGIEELRQAVCVYLKGSQGLIYKPSQVVICSGAKHALYNIFQVILDPGDEVIVPAPYWVSYPEQIKLAEGNPVIVETTESEGFILTPEKLRKTITPKTRALILNSPSNPTGAIYNEEQLLEIARLALEYGFYIISDEIYNEIIYDGRSFKSIAALGEEIKQQTIIVNGVSKTYSMTGWRIGYAVGEETIIKAITDLQSHSTSNPTSFAQKASVDALLGDQAFVRIMVQEFKKRRDYMVEKLNGMPGIECSCPPGAFYVFPNISGLIGKKHNDQEIKGSLSFAELLLQKARVAVIPGIAFGNDNHIRLSYATSFEKIKQGLERIERFVWELK
ncbi:MAG TPA: pyridoxal phosphate-dependent aminotransferase [Clostridia bacterium]|jgi:aspartate aminotransferase|nr:pyridoxal phosphate-dependent aminotransferase [Clostridia bacterium]